MSERRTWLLAVVVAALIAAAGISTWAVAGTAADSSPDVAGVEPDHQFTVLAASVLTRPSAVRGTDGRFHIAYELVLTNASRSRSTSSESMSAMPRPTGCCSRLPGLTWSPG